MSEAFVEIMVTGGNGILSRDIQWWGGGGWAHWTNLIGDGWVIDAQAFPQYLIEPWGESRRWYKGGVQYRPLSSLTSCPRWAKLRIPCTYRQRLAWLTALESQVGKPYDFRGIWQFATGQMRDRNYENERAWFCDELGVWALQRAGICPPLTVKPNRIPPGPAFWLAQILPGAHITAFKN